MLSRRAECLVDPQAGHLRYFGGQMCRKAWPAFAPVCSPFLIAGMPFTSTPALAVVARRWTADLPTRRCYQPRLHMASNRPPCCSFVVVLDGCGLAFLGLKCITPRVRIGQCRNVDS